MCVETAEPLVRAGYVVHQKWACGTCGSRQTMAELNKFYTAGKCEECEAVTKITMCNYLLMGVPR